MPLVFESEEGDLELSDNEALFFLDETGHEELADPNYRVFGIGGVGLLARDYTESVRGDWRQMKAAFFGGEDNPLHAADLKNIESKQIDALNDFFKRPDFTRLFVGCSDKAAIAVEGEKVRLDLFAQLLKERIRDSRLSLSGGGQIYIIFEENQRLDNYIASYFDDFKSIWDGHTLRLVNKFRMPKTAIEPALEIADFICHTSGNQLAAFRSEFEKASPKDWRHAEMKLRKDFGVIWSKEIPEEQKQFFN